MTESHVMRIPPRVPQPSPQGNTEGLLVNEPKPNSSGNNTNPTMTQYTWWDFAGEALEAGWKEIGEGVHTGLDVLGAIPVVGAAFDGLNGVIYAAEGDAVNAAISFSTAALDFVPGAGTVAKGSKFVYKAASRITKGATKSVVKVAEKTGIKQAEKSVIKQVEKGSVKTSEKNVSKATEKEANQATGKATKREDGIAIKEKKENAGPLKNCPKSGHPVNPILGCKFLTGETELDFVLPSVFPLLWQRHYFSDQMGNGWLGDGWSLSFSRCLLRKASDIIMIDHQGRMIKLPRLDEGQYKFNRCENIFLARESNGRYCITSINDRLRYIFSPLSLGDKDPQGHSSLYFPLIAIEDMNGNHIRITYNNAGLPINIYDAIGNHLDLNFIDLCLPNGNRVYRLHSIFLLHREENVTVGRKQLVTYHYSIEGDLISVEDEEKYIRRKYKYKNHILIEHSQPNGIIARYEYDQYTIRGKVVRHTSNLGQTWLFDYRDGETRVTDPLHRLTTYQYNSNKEFIGFINAKGQLTRASLDNLGRPITFTTPNGHQTHYAYDNFSRISSIIDANGGRTSIRYDIQHRPIAVMDVMGHTTRYEYNDTGDLIRITNAEKHVTEYYFNKQGLISGIKSNDGNVRHIEYDPKGFLSAYIDCSGFIFRATNDINGNIKAITNPDKTQVIFTYNIQGKLLTSYYSDGYCDKYSYNSHGQQITHANAIGAKTFWQLDIDGLPLKRTNACGGIFYYQYDNARRLVCLTNENKDDHRITYDDNDNIICEKNFNGATTQYQYDDDGMLIKKYETNTQDLGIVTFYRRDALGNITEKIIRNKAVNTEVNNQYKYNAAGLLIKASNAQSLIERDYNKIGLLISESYVILGKNYIIKHEYDENSHRCRTTLPDGTQFHYLYYGMGHLVQINIDKEVLCEIERDSMHREITRTQGKLTSRFTYTSCGQLLSQQTYNETSFSDFTPPLISRRYQYDQARNLKGLIELHGGRKNFRYDLLGRLLQCNEEHFSFDPAHNLSMHGNKIENSLLKNYGNHHYIYDSHGNLSQVITDKQLQLCFHYNPEHQLEYLENKRYGKHKVVQYSYDALGRRLSKTSDKGTVIYLWDEDRLLSEYHDGKTITYLYEHDSFIPLAQLVQNEPGDKKIYYYHTDQIGTPHELTTSDGNIVWRASYRAWGNISSTDNPGQKNDGEIVHQPLRFQGQYYDEESGLHYNRYRYYDPNTSRFITPDPIGLVGGENSYQYAPNPTVWSDPLGLMNKPSGSGISTGKIGQASYEYDKITKNMTIVTHGGPFTTQTDRLASGSSLAKQVKNVVAGEGGQINRVTLQSCYSSLGGAASQGQQLANKLNRPVTAYSGKFTQETRMGASRPLDGTGGVTKTFQPSTSNIGKSVSSAANKAGNTAFSGVYSISKLFKRPT